MLINTKKIILIAFFSLLLCFQVFLYVSGLDNSFYLLSVCGTLICLFCGILLCIWQRGIFTGINIFYAMFCLFQFGLPILYALEKYRNYYLNYFTDSLLISAARYSIFAIIIVALGLCLSQFNNDKKSFYKERKLESHFNENGQLVCDAALILFVISALIIVPITLKAVLTQIKSGAYTIDNRSILSERAITRFGQEFFYSSGFLYLCFSKKPLYKNIIKALLAIECICMMLLADRAMGLVGLFILLYYMIFVENRASQKRSFRESRKRALYFLIVIVAAGVAMVVIAQLRLGRSVASGNVILNLLNNVLGEFGFNFTTICFVMAYVPWATPFALGRTYASAFIDLIPSSLDLLSIRSSLATFSGTSWLYNMNNLYGRQSLSFGVGFSLIGESYMNFSWFGLIVILLIGFCIGKLLKIKKDSAWSNYIHVIMLFNLFMFPRREFETLLKSVEYAILFMGLYLLVFIALFKKVPKWKYQNTAMME